MTAHPDQIGKAILDCAASFASQDDFSGVVMVQSAGSTVASAAYGMADPARGVKNDLETPFNIASVGKIFTATAVGQLIDARKVRLTDKASKYLPELPHALGDITVAQLLDHSSGLPDVWKEHRSEFAKAGTARELVPLIAAKPLLFKPGTRHLYSNTGPILAAAIVEAVSGLSFEEYVQKNVFQPAGMGASTIRARPSTAAQMLTRSEVLTGEMQITSGAKVERRVSALTGGGGPHGGGYSNAPDLARFAQALTSGRLLSAQTREQLWSHAVDVPGAGPGKYAYGFQTTRTGPMMSVGHSGLLGGANAEVHWSPDGAWSVVVLSNYDPMAATIIGNAARLALLGLETPENSCAAARAGRGMPQPVGPAPGPIAGPDGGPVRAPASSHREERG